MTEQEEAAFFAGVVASHNVKVYKSGVRLHVDTPRRLIQEMSVWLDCLVTFRARGGVSTRAGTTFGWRLTNAKNKQRYNHMMAIVLEHI